jgi:hypothetical protein
MLVLDVSERDWFSCNIASMSLNFLRGARANAAFASAWRAAADPNGKTDATKLESFWKLLRLWGCALRGVLVLLTLFLLSF